MSEFEPLKVKFKKLHESATVPTRATPNSVGFDLCSVVQETIPPGHRALVATGIAVAIPNGWEGQVRPRSGLAAKSGITVLNAPGTIDPDYRGEVKVILVNLGQHVFTIHPGERIAQLVFSQYHAPDLVECDSLDDTERGNGGFGSTGV